MESIKYIKDRIRQLELEASYFSERQRRRKKTATANIGSVMLNGRILGLFKSATELRKIIQEPHWAYPGKHALECRKCGRIAPYNIDFWRVRILRERYREKCRCGSINLKYIEEEPWEIITEEEHAKRKPMGDAR